MQKRGAHGWIRGRAALLVCVLVGAAVNLGVAWCGVIGSVRAFSTTLENTSVGWPVDVPTEWGANTQTGSYGSAFQDRIVVQTPPNQLVGYVFLNRAGWPLRAMEGWRMGGYTLQHTEWHFLFSVKIGDRSHLLPLKPIWPGFALNTLFYAALAWGLWQLPLALRRRSRAKKGLCVRCGYDLKGLAAGSACPECGNVPRGRG